MDDPYNLTRFLDAQIDVYENVINELLKGYKVGHWMWFVFPQVKGLGFSSTSLLYSIRSKEEAVCYFKHPLLGKRLTECTRMVVDINGKSSKDIFGHIDTLKFKSSMTLFDAVQSESAIFRDALEKYYNGAPDAFTIEFLNR